MLQGGKTQTPLSDIRGNNKAPTLQTPSEMLNKCRIQDTATYFCIFTIRAAAVVKNVSPLARMRQSAALRYEVKYC